MSYKIFFAVSCGLVKKEGHAAPADRCRFGLLAFHWLPSSRKILAEEARMTEILDPHTSCKEEHTTCCKPHYFRLAHSGSLVPC